MLLQPMERLVVGEEHKFIMISFVNYTGILVAQESSISVVIDFFQKQTPSFLDKSVTKNSRYTWYEPDISVKLLKRSTSAMIKLCS